MSDEEERMITAEEIAHLDAIFDKSRRVETKEDILKLAELVEEEGE